MEISRQNYEQYFIDYLDGKLSPEQVGILMSFIYINPDLKEELAGIEKFSLDAGQIVFSGKERLFKSEADHAEEIILEDFDLYCISSVEEDITREEEKILLSIIEDDPDRNQTFKHYRSTRLRADESILYPGKSKLKKWSIPVLYRILMPVAAAAAIWAIIFTIFTGKPIEERNLTETDQVKVPVPVIQDPAPARQKPTFNLDQGKDPAIEPKVFADTEIKNLSGQKSRRETIQLGRIEPITVSTIQSPSIAPNQNQASLLALYQNMEGNEYRPAKSKDEPRLSLWKLADAGVRGLNSLAEDETHLERKKDEQGNTRRFTLDTPIFGISAPLRNPNTAE